MTENEQLVMVLYNTRLTKVCVVIYECVVIMGVLLFMDVLFIAYTGGFACCYKCRHRAPRPNSDKSRAYSLIICLYRIYKLH
jgi:hypothetical protein